MVKIDSVLKQRLIIYGSLLTVLFLYFFMLIKSDVYSFSMLWGFFIVLPILLAVDICYFMLPLTVFSLFGLSIYTITKKDYTKFNELYKWLLIMVVVGLFNLNIEKMLDSSAYVNEGSFIKLYWNAIAAVACTLNIMFLSRIKDTRVYISTYVLAVILYVFYIYADIVE